MSQLPDPIPLFDTLEYMHEFQLPKSHPELPFFQKDFRIASEFLRQYDGSLATFNSYRRELERLLQWSWFLEQKSLLELKRIDIEEYLQFCKDPPLSWIGVNKVPRFIIQEGLRIPNPVWRPFVATLSKIATKNGEEPERKNYQLSEKAFREIFAVLSSFYNYLLQENLTEANPIAQIRQKSKFLRRHQNKTRIRRLSELQWQFVIETAEKLANENPEEHERTLFIMTALFAMYLRISELVASERWLPKMNDFKRDQDGNWWFTVVGKGNKERQIAVSQAMLEALKRWRQHLGLTPLPLANEQIPLIPKNRGKGPVVSTNQIRNIVQLCFDRAAIRMEQEGLGEEAAELRVATVHWLRHTGISEDVKIRPREHVRDDAGHSSGAITDRYIDIELRERHRSAQQKPLK